MDREDPQGKAADESEADDLVRLEPVQLVAAIEDELGGKIG